MDSRNICKFTTAQSSDLNCSGFIYESTDCQKVPDRAQKNCLHLVIKGSGSFICNGVSFTISEGTLFFLRRGEIFSIIGDGLEYCYIRFDGRRGDELMERVGIERGRRVFEDHSALIPFWRECLSASDEGNLDLLAEAVLLYSIARLKPEHIDKSDLVANMISITSERFTDHSLTLSTIARELGYNEKYMSSHFKKETGQNYTQYLRNMRVNHAVFLMEQGVVSVKNVAILSGFFDALYFSKVFKEEKGVSPKEYISGLEKISFEG